MVTGLKNIIPLGILDWGIYPAKNTKPIIYLYYRPNGDLMLYRTCDEIEINLTNISAYDNNTLFYFGTEQGIKDIDITKFESSSIVVNKSTYTYTYIRPSNVYMYILVPAIYTINSIFLNGNVATTEFALQGVYTHGKLNYYIYRTPSVINLDKDFVVQVIYAALTQEDLKTFLVHVDDFNNPHKVTKEQIGLPDVDNTSDINKPISILQQQALDNLKTLIETSSDDISELLNKHIEDFDNPHKVTLEQLGIDALSVVDFKDGDSSSKQTDLHIIRGTTLQLSKVPIVNKQLLFNTDTQTFYLDSVTSRVKYSGSGIENVLNADANLLITPNIYMCRGTKQNFYVGSNVDYNNSNSEFILFVNQIDNVIKQTIYDGTKIVSRTKNINDTDFNNWEIFDLNSVILSSQIKRIEIIGESQAPVYEDNVLYIEIPGYEDGVDYMEVQEQLIIPPFRVFPNE